MADSMNNPAAILSLITTTAARLKELTIKDGQMVFIPERNRIVFDWNGKRTFYNSIEILEAEAERLALENPLTGYYFVVDKAVLWHYNGGWTQVTNKPENFLFIDVSLPELGNEGMLYVNKEEQEISVWDEATQNYIEVGDTTDSIPVEDILSVFN